jgi:hypothetical protein
MGKIETVSFEYGGGGSQYIKSSIVSSKSLIDF